MASVKALERESQFEDNDYLKNRVTDFALTGCSECHHRKPRICLDCTPKEEITMKKLENGVWIIDQSIGPPNSNFRCADCAFECQESHETVQVSRIQNIEDILKLEYFFNFLRHEDTVDYVYVIHATKSEDEVQWMRKFLDNKEKLDETFSMEMKNSYDESKRKIDEALENIYKLMIREKMIHLERLELWINDHKKRLEKAENQKDCSETQRVLERLLRVKKRIQGFTENFSMDLTPGDIEKIDMKTTGKMLELEKKYKERLFVQIELEEVDAKFHKYQALSKELQEMNSTWTKFEPQPEDQKLKKKLKELKPHIEELENHPEATNYEDEKKELERSQKFYQMQYMEHIFTDDKKFMERLEWEKRLLFARLIHLKFFPVGPDSDPQDIVYDRFLRD